MRGMNRISIAADGQSATLGGGLTSKEITDYLWKRGKQTGELDMSICFSNLGA